MELTAHALLLPLVLAALLHPTTATIDDATPGLSGGFSLRLVPSPSWNNTIHVNDDGFLHLKELVGHDTTALRPHVRFLPGRYNVVTTVGTGHGRRTYTLAMEMTSSLTWMQCVLIQCPFQQDPPPFHPRMSPSFRHLAPTSRLCSPPGPDVCKFHVTPIRPGGAHASGVLGDETLSFTGSAPVVFPTVIIGCAHSSTGFVSHGVLAGVLGLGKTYPSLVPVLLQRHGLHRFSYCLFVPGSANRHGFLRFGNDIPVDTRRMKSTRILYPEHSSYFVSLGGISVAGTQLGGNLAEVFRRRQTADGKWHSGTVIDVGTSRSVIIQAAYNVLEQTLAEHGRRLGLPVHHTSSGLCFRAAHSHFSQLPTVTLHFEQDLVLTPIQLFVVREQDICLAVSPSPDITIIGALQQRRTRFVYDLAASRVYFTPENCNDGWGCGVQGL
ncbi:aspartyl protease family protein 2-like [Triticum dicoccoides]|uniref:aspartyl protease family protein 2-like n=1 Tax=Triticum dicoccoides TaxID=85692 RepID=UPI001890E2F0|nr:aspartyl protease family protein 2-like [Triticum dicoccoides]